MWLRTWELRESACKNRQGVIADALSVFGREEMPPTGGGIDYRQQDPELNVRGCICGWAG
jgi:hypothetical protein